MRTYIIILLIIGAVLGIGGIVKEEPISVIVGCYCIIMARLYTIEQKIDNRRQ